MCLIIDTNRFSILFADPRPSELHALFGWLENDGGSLAIGGTKYREEIGRVHAAQRLFAQMNRAGRTTSVCDVDVDADALELTNSGVLQSDDAHIVALARRSGARTVYTEDVELMKDIKSKKIVDNPRGRIYRNKSHSRLLKHDSSCPK